MADLNVMADKKQMASTPTTNKSGGIQTKTNMPKRKEGGGKICATSVLLKTKLLLKQ